MSHDDTFFTPEDIDERIDSLTRAGRHVPETAQPAERLVSHLRHTYRRDLRQLDSDSFNRAWNRIVAGHQAVQHTPQRTGKLISMENYQSGQQNSSAPRKQRTFIQRFGVVAAVLFIGLLVGGMALALNISHTNGAPGQKQTQLGSGGKPFPTPAHPITGGACTIDTTRPHAQQSQRNLPGLYIFAANPESDNLLYRYDPQAKKAMWSIKLCNAFRVSGTIARNGVLYVSGVDSTKEATTGSVSYLYALNQSDGSAIWGVQFPAKVVPFAKGSGASPLDLGVIEAPTLVNNTLYVLLRTGVAYAYNATTGSQLWSFDSGHNAWATTSQGNGGSIMEPSSIQVVNDVAYFSIVDRVVALDAQHGTKLWMYNFKSPLTINQAPAIDNGVVYVSTFDASFGHPGDLNAHIYAIDALTGTQKWVSPKLTNFYVNGPVAFDGQVHAMDYNGVWYTLNPSSGAITTKMTLPGEGHDSVASPVWINGTLYSLSSNGNELAVLNPDGSAKWSIKAKGLYPSIQDVQGGVIYVSSRGSGVYAYSAADGSLLWHYEGYRTQPESDLLVTAVA